MTSKRAMDLGLSIPGLLIIAPFLLLISGFIWLYDRGPVFFVQERVGLGGKPFRMFKFRTMVVDAERLGGKLTIGGDGRITRLGAWLRQLKLDELPQLFNVIRGEMSLVGPRPEVPEFVGHYDAEQRKVLGLLPGVTDPASIAYLNESEMLARAENPREEYIRVVLPAKIRINLDYAATANLWSDVRVICQTLWRVGRS